MLLNHSCKASLSIYLSINDNADTIRTIEGYADCIVLRHNLAGSAKRAAAAASVPIINAGDGPGQHPTQVLLKPRAIYFLLTVYLKRADICNQRTSCQLTLISRARSMICVQAVLDMFTIQQEVGHLDNLKIGLVGDLANGRTVRSLAYLLSMYDGVKMYFVAPDVVRMKDDIKEFLTGRQVLFLYCIDTTDGSIPVAW